MARQLFLTGRIDDDRGQRFTLREQGLLAPHTPAFKIAKKLGRQIERREEVIAAALAKRAVLRLEPTSIGKRVAPFRIFLLFVCICLVLVLAIAKGFPSAIMLTFLIGLYFVSIADRKKQLARSRAQLRSLPNVCVVCIYDLSGIPHEADGCTICPECGGAWNLGDHD